MKTVIDLTNVLNLNVIKKGKREKKSVILLYKILKHVEPV